MSDPGRWQWEGPVGCVCAVMFIACGLHLVLLTPGTWIRGIGPELLALVLAIVAGLWVGASGLRRGNLANRLLCVPVVIFFAGGVALLVLRALG